MSQARFAREVRAVVGRGWSRQVAWQVENGQKPLTANDLLAVAHVLGCTVQDLVGGQEPVSLGVVTVARTDALVAGDDSMPEAEAWTRFLEAGAALADVRAAWTRYAHLLDGVRQRVETVPGLRSRIEGYGERATAALRDEVRDAYEFRSPDGLDPYAEAKWNRTPAMVVSGDALAGSAVSESQWWARPRKATAR